MNVWSGRHAWNAAAKRQERYSFSDEKPDQRLALHTVRMYADVHALPMVQAPTVV